MSNHEQDDLKPSSNRHIPRKLVAGLAFAAIMFGGAKYSVEQIGDRATDKTRHEYAEEMYLSNSLKCLNKLVLLRSGVKLRDTPDIVNTKLPFGIDNVAAKVTDDKEIPVERPLYYKDSNDTEWIGFTEGVPKPTKSNSISPLADDVQWVNYSGNSDTRNSKNQLYVRTFKISNAGDDRYQTCNTQLDGTIISQGKPAAYGEENQTGLYEHFRALSDDDFTPATK